MNMQKQQKALLALADGRVFHGVGFGRKPGGDAAVGEVVFNTSMYGYQEILTDPSYAGQIMTFTYPHIGNVGCNSCDNESDRVHVRGVVIRNQSLVSSNFRSEETLESFLRNAQVLGIEGIDTRDLVRHIRDQGAQMGALAYSSDYSVDDLVDIARAEGTMLGKNYVKDVTCREPYSWNELPWSLRSDSYPKLSQDGLWSRPHVVALDCGVKRNILRLLLDSGFRVTVVPATSTAEEILAISPDAMFISNGPGDPATLSDTVAAVKSLLGKFPIFGICLGHQILAQALGGKTYKLKFGHRGGNHPVMDMTTRKVEITSQNHGFAVSDDSLSSDVVVSHVNLNDRTVEGLAVAEYKAFCIQYHPEASPGPHDSRYLFRRFFETAVGYKQGGL